MNSVRMQSAGNSIKKALDAAAIAALAFVCLSGVVLRGATTPVGREVGITPFNLAPLAFGLSKGEWGSIHDQASILFVVLLLPNLIWGWSSLTWIFRRGERTGSFFRTAIGVLAACTLLAILVSGLHFAGGRRPELPSDAVPLLGKDSDTRISELSLEQIEKRLDIPVAYMRSNLGLPTNVDINEPLSSLMPKNRITIEAVRGVIFMHRMGKTFPRSTVTPPPPRPH